VGQERDLKTAETLELVPKPDSALSGEHPVEFGLRAGSLLGDGRLRLIRKIGAGGMGVVYEAFDAERDTRVALKTLLRMDAESIFRLKNEFRTLASVSHPNLVRLFELYAEGPIWFFTMDLVDGKPFDEWVRAGMPDRYGTCNEARLRPALGQLVSAVQAIHGARKLHRDLKPSNVLVTATGRVCILDFGLVTDWQPGGIGQTLDGGQISGTPAYMAPEQAAGRAATVASDAYALGAMLFEALTGRLPFEGPTSEVLAIKQVRSPPHVLEIDDSLPRDLADLCARLLAPEPEARAGMDDVAGALRSDASRVHIQEPVTRRTDARLIGREAELSALREAYALSLAGHPVLVAVAGESGIGKTALCQAFLDELRAEGEAVVLAGRCYERESVPFKAFDALIDELSRHLRRLPKHRAASVLPRDVFALAKLFPALERVDLIADAPPKEIPDPDELQARAFAAFGEWLGRLRDRQPVVLYIDDLQWTDADSVRFLRRLFSQRGAAPVLFVVSHRSEEQTADGLMALAIAAAIANREWVLRRQHLQVLSTEDATALAASLIGDEAAGSAIAAQIAAESGGNPFFATGLCQLSRRGGADPLQLPSFVTLLNAQLERLPDAARRLIQMLALAASPLSLEIALSAAGATHVDLDALRAGHLIRTWSRADRRVMECYHDRIRESVCTTLTAAQIRLCYADLARAVTSARKIDFELALRCLEGSGDPRGAAHFAVLAAEAAERALAFDHAAALYERALQLGEPELHDPMPLTIRRGYALENAGRGVEAAAAYQQAAARAEGLQSLDLRRRAAEQLLVTGHVSSGTGLLRAVCTELGLGLPHGMASARAALAWGTLRLRLRGLRPARAAAPSAETALRLETARTAVTGLGGYLPGPAAKIATDYLRMALQTNDSRHLVHALGFNAAIHSSVDPKGTWSRALRAALEAAVDADQRPELVGFAQLALGAASLEWSDYRAARDLVKRALESLRDCVGVGWELDVSHFYDQYLATLCGEYAEVAAMTPPLIEHAYSRGRLWLSTLLSGLPGLAAYITLDDPNGFEACLREARARWDPGPEVQWPDHLLDMAEVYLSVYRGRPDQGCAFMEARMASLGRSILTKEPSSDRAPIPYLFYGAAAASALGQQRGGPRSTDSALRFESIVQRCIATLLRFPNPILRGAAKRYEAALALHRGQPEAAVEHLRQAVAIHDEDQTAMYAAGARRRLGQLLAGDEGAALVAQAEAFMRSQSVKNIDAMTEVHCAGCRVA
jgi:eukaryotic-like serine/threonine-protein kinase